MRLGDALFFFGNAFVKLHRKQKVTTIALRKWNKQDFGLCHTRISELSTKIELIQCQLVTEENARLEAKLQWELNEWLTRNDILWKQKSQKLWLRNGDRNTMFFHLSTIIRRRQNSIDAIRADSGEWIVDKKNIWEHIKGNFQNLFTAKDVDFPQDLDNLISSIIEAADNPEHTRIPSYVEIKKKKKVILDMESLKAPGPDGLSPYLLQTLLAHCWKQCCKGSSRIFYK